MLISIDPGDRHVGIAQWQDGRCVDTCTVDRREAEDKLTGMLSSGCIERVVCEEWTLYSWNATDLIGSEMLTSQLIGVIRYLTRIHGIPLHMQQTQIKKPTFKQMQNRHVRLLGQTQHELDAEAHGYHYLYRLS